jgi:hypothetical protein
MYACMHVCMFNTRQKQACVMCEFSFFSRFSIEQYSYIQTHCQTHFFINLYIYMCIIIVLVPIPEEKPREVLLVPPTDDDDDDDNDNDDPLLSFFDNPGAKIDTADAASAM